jgi:hypothetical protein
MAKAQGHERLAQQRQQHVQLLGERAQLPRRPLGDLLRVLAGLLVHHEELLALVEESALTDLLVVVVDLAAVVEVSLVVLPAGVAQPAPLVTAPGTGHVVTVLVLEVKKIDREVFFDIRY